MSWHLKHFENISVSTTFTSQWEQEVLKSPSGPKPTVLFLQAQWHESAAQPQMTLFFDTMCITWKGQGLHKSADSISTYSENVNDFF